MEFFLMWLITFLWSIKVPAGVVVFLGTILTLVSIVILIAMNFASIDEMKDDCEDVSFKNKKYLDIAKLMFKYFGGVTLFAVILSAAVPDKDDLKWIAGGGLALMAVQNEEVQKLPVNVVKSVNYFLESMDIDETVEKGKQVVNDAVDSSPEIVEKVKEKVVSEINTVVE